MSELVTKGMRHAAPPIILRVECEGEDALRYWSAGRIAGRAERQPRQARRRVGCGIFLVDDISDEWGAEPTVDGKLTWFRLDN